MIILGIESSCDDSALALVIDGKTVLSNHILSQSQHQPFGGIVPELASREHLQHFYSLFDIMLKETHIHPNNIDRIAVTYGPGLRGSLMIGFTIAKTMAYLYQKPLVKINHLEAHFYSANLEHQVDFPFIGLLISGGHTLLALAFSWKKIHIIGTTLDDALGEAYDKVASLMGFGYPGGSTIDQLAHSGNPNIYWNNIPQPMINTKHHRYQFSYSGIKTAVRRFIQKNPHYSKPDLAATFQTKVIDGILKKTKLLLKDTQIPRLVVCGGVACNQYLRTQLKILQDQGLQVYIPSIPYCQDNAAMIAGLGFHQPPESLEDSLTVDVQETILPFHYRNQLAQNEKQRLQTLLEQS